MSEAGKFKKLDLLLDQTTLYSKFLAEKIPDEHKNFGKEEDKDNTPSKKKRKTGSSSPSSNRRGKQNLDHRGLHKMLAKGITLRDYQMKGVDWIISLYENGLNGILADEMGLGKTIQVITFIAYLRSMKVNGPFLIVAPLSTLHGWLSEFKRFTPNTPVQLYHGSKEERAEFRLEWPSDPLCSEFPVILTSFELTINDEKFLSKIPWKVLTVDEGHRLKNMECKLIRTLKDYNTENRLILTGTPLQNNLKELWSLLNFLLPQIFDSLDRFQSWFNFDNHLVSSNVDDEGRADIVQQERENQIVSKLHEILRPFVLRRLKSDVLKGMLPEKKEFVLYTPLTDIQTRYYKAILEGNARQYFSKTHCGTGLKNLFMQLRKVCNHPYLLMEPEDENGEMVTDERIVTFCGKFLLLDKLLKKLKKNDHRVLIFSQMTTILTILEDFLDYRGYTSCRIDGSVAAKTRQEHIVNYNKDDTIFAFLLSTRAGGLGINLTAADSVIIFDSDWNPTQDDQAQDRCHRIGQTRAVRVFRFITPGSVEKNMLLRANSKRKLEELVLGKGNFNKATAGKGKKLSSADAITQELMTLFEIEGGGDEKENNKPTTTSSSSSSSSSSPSTIINKQSPYVNGCLSDAILDHILDRNTSIPYEDGFEKGFTCVHKATSFRDLF